MRQHAQRKRAPGRRGTRWAALIVLGGAIGCLVVQLTTAPCYAIRGAEIEGPAELVGCARACVPIGANAYLTRMGRLERTIARDLRIERASVKRAGPGMLRIALAPRLAEAQAPMENGGFGLVDAQGLVFDERREREETALIGGLPRDGLAVGGRIDPGCMGTVLAVRREVSRQGLGRVAEVRFAPDGRVDAVMATGAEIRLGRAEEIRDKVAVAAAAVRSMAPGSLAYVDVELLRHVVMAPRSE